MSRDALFGDLAGLYITGEVARHVTESASRNARSKPKRRKPRKRKRKACGHTGGCGCNRMGSARGAF